MNDNVILGTVVMLVSLNTALPALASQQDDARNAAEVAVINQEVVAAQVLRSHGDEYTREFLLQFHNATQKYRQAFQLGIADQEEGRTHAFGDHVEQAAYQRGIEKAKAQTQEKTGAKENTFSDQLVDQKRYLPKQPLPNQARFINQIADDARQIGKNYDLYPSIIIAQAALESNWGTSDLSLAPHHNLFGVKGKYNGRGVLKPTTEFVGSQSTQVQDIFRSYTSTKQSLQDYAKTLQQPLYREVHRSVVKSYREATHALVGRYATDPDYDKKLNQIIDSYQLTRYDKPKKDGNTQSQIINSRQYKMPRRSHLRELHQQTSPKHKKFSPVVSVVGGAASAGALTGLKKLLVS